MKSKIVIFWMVTAILFTTDAQSSETKWVDLVDHSHDPDYTTLQQTRLPSQPEEQPKKVYLRGGSRDEIYEKQEFEVNPVSLSPPESQPLPSQPAYETQVVTQSSSAEYEKSSEQQENLQSNIMPGHLSEAEYKRSVPPSSNFNMKLESNAIELSTAGIITDIPNAIVSPEVAAVIGKTLVEKERLVQHLDSQLQEAGETRDYDTAARLHNELKEAKEHVSQLQTDLFAAAAASAVIPQQIASETSENLSTDSTTVAKEIGLYTTEVANPTAADGVADAIASASNVVDQKLGAPDSQLVGGAGGAAEAPIEALAPPEIIPNEVLPQLLQAPPVDVSNIGSASNTVENPTAADGVADAIASNVVDQKLGAPDSQLVGGAGGAAEAPIEALAPPEIIPNEVLPQLLQAPLADVAAPVSALALTESAPESENVMASVAVTLPAKEKSEASMPTNSIFTYIAESQAACKVKLGAKKLALTSQLTAAKQIVDHFITEAKFSGIKELTIQFVANKIADPNEAYRPETIDSQGCRVSDIKLDPHQKTPTLLKAGPEGKTLYRIAASLPLGTLAAAGCNSIKCVTVGEYCDITTQEAIVAHTNSALQLESAELSLLASQSSATLQRRLALQQLFSADEVSAAGRLGVNSEGGLVFLAWEYISAGYFVEVNKNFNALDFYLWKPHPSLPPESEDKSLVKAAPLTELDYITGHLPCTW